MDPYILGGIIGGIGSLGSSIVGNTLGYNQSKKLMDYQYQLQQQAIDRANEFNHPSQQMKRLAEAQLNPNLVYGSGVDGNQSSAANPSLANRQVKIDNPLQDMSQNLLARKQMELEQIRVRNEAFESRERQLNLREKTLGQMLSNSYSDKTLSTRIEHAQQKLLNDVERQSIMAEQRNNLLIQRDVLVEQAYQLAAKTKLTQEQALTEVVKRGALAAGIKLTNAQIREVAHRIEYLDSGTDLRNLEYDIKDTEWESTNELDKWLADHPNVQLTEQILDRIIDKVAKVTGNGSSRRGSRTSRRRKR